ncbi:uncharacterized protein MELLADRAFT_124521 [Melampsora larici-populina 98AG31]|uniref:Secreted protein n=1 Tax=Melampsora larici-populina (strain 98AG31 / pathotype 3-4-7) TaxID=747676 RepID=F4RT71_MELLP|nr:uncharacterized protein MELLADRAFT_124521 [Melampsora larici-populina 98AG31]EGG04457.1 secreted protein [Melampsora larici-populina 98AG31]
MNLIIIAAMLMISVISFNQAFGAIITDFKRENAIIPSEDVLANHNDLTVDVTEPNGTCVCNPAHPDLCKCRIHKIR